MDKELIWVKKEFAEKYNALETEKAQEEAVKRLINQKGIDLDEEQELLSENLLQFKSVCLAHKRKLTEVYEEQAQKLESLWEEMGDVGSMVSKHAEDVAEKINPISEQVKSLQNNVSEIQRAVRGLDFYIPENIVRLTETVASMDDKTKGLLQSLLKIEKGG